MISPPVTSAHSRRRRARTSQSPQLGLLEDRIPNLRVILAGEGPLRPSLMGSAPASVVFPGYVDDPARFYPALDLFLMPSRSEAWGLAALGAMAQGVPVIASATGGLNEMIELGVSGWLVPPNDPVALADAIHHAYSNPDDLRKIGLRARERAGALSTQAMATSMESFYRRILAERILEERR